MKVVQGDQLTFVRGLEHRGGTFHSIIMMEGEEGTLGNFQVSYGRIGGDFFSPRHRHNFEQIRFQIEGALDFARDGKLEEGMVGYFPEGVAYGPQTAKRRRRCRDHRTAMRRRQRQRLSVAGRGPRRGRRAQERGRIQGWRVPPPRRISGQAQRRRLPSNLGACERSFDALSRTTLFAPLHDEPRPLFLGSAGTERGRFGKIVGNVHRTAQFGRVPKFFERFAALCLRPRGLCRTVRHRTRGRSRVVPPDHALSRPRRAALSRGA